MSKQDRQACRTPAQLEQKYALGKLGKSFAEALDIASDAREAAEEASQEINDMFTKNIVMTGTFTNTVMSKLYPGKAEHTMIEQHLLGTSLIPDSLVPLYDFNQNGEIDEGDMWIAYNSMQGLVDSRLNDVVRDTPVTLKINLSDPRQAIHVYGENMWGGFVSTTFGTGFTNAKNSETERKLDELSENYIVEQDFWDREGANWEYRKWSSGVAECWGRVTDTVSTVDVGKAYCGAGFDIFYPFPFIEVPIVNANSEGKRYCTATIRSVNTNSFNLYYTTFSEAYSGEVPVYVHVIGRWK